MKVSEVVYQGRMTKKQECALENVVEIETNNLRVIVEKISTTSQCRYPLLAIRILIYAITGIDESGKIYISARQLAKSLNAHYDTVTKCLKFLRDAGILSFDNDIR